MHNLQVIKNAAADAMDEDDRGALNAFRAIVDPESVLEMAGIIQVLLQEVERSGSNPQLVEQVTHHLSGGFAAPEEREDH